MVESLPDVFFTFWSKNTITKTRIFKYIENFTSKKKKKKKVCRQKNPDIFHISAKNIDCGTR